MERCHPKGVPFTESRSRALSKMMIWTAGRVAGANYLQIGVTFCGRLHERRRRPQKGEHNLPIGLCSVVLVYGAAVVRGPDEALIIVHCRCLLEHLLVEIDDKAFLSFVVGEGRPRQGMLLFAHPKEAAKGHDRVD